VKAKRFRTLLALAALLVAVGMFAAGCGGKPKADVSIFLMGPNGVPQEAADKLLAGLKAAVGTAPTLNLQAAPLFSMELMIVQLAAGDHDIFILPSDQFQTLAKQGGLVPLENLVNKDDYKAGIVESNDNGKVETHLYGLPLDDSKWFKDQGLSGKGLTAFIPVNSKHQDNAKKVIAIMAAK
jgi:ABC-type glycerol-3-phosphate transport system substrate-binding protein